MISNLFIISGIMNYFVVLGAIVLVTLLEVEADLIKNLADVPCGRAVIKRGPKIVGGVNTYHGELPFLASIRAEDNEHFCAGFIINRQYILTAAHCFFEYMFSPAEELNLKVVLGEHNLIKPEYPKSTAKFKVKKLIVHPGFSYMGYANDIALLRLNKNITWSSYVQPLCLPGKNFKTISPEPEAMVGGWGLTKEEQTDAEWKKLPILRKVTVPIWQDKECQKVYANEGFNWVMQDTHICAGVMSGGRDTCQGDSGGPLMLPDKTEKHWTAVGIVSTGKGCGTPGIPGIYTKCSSFLKWIEDTIYNRHS